MAKKKSRKQGPQQIALWQWGLIVITAGVVANMALGFLPPPGNSAAAQGQAFGRGLVTVLAVLTGLVLIVVHFVRGRR